MVKYKVSFWFNDSDGLPDKIIFVDSDNRLQKKEIIDKAVRQLDKRPRSYEVLVDEIHDDDYYVIQVINTDQAHTKAWYKYREGQMFVAYRSIKDMFAIAHSMDDSSTVGVIESKFCKVLTTFKYEAN